jgi:hypothetical protein
MFPTCAATHALDPFSISLYGQSLSLKGMDQGFCMTMKLPKGTPASREITGHLAIMR